MTKISNYTNFPATLKDYEGKPVTLGVRPENIYLMGDLANTDPVCEFKLKADLVELLGSRFIVYGNVGTANIVLEANTNNNLVKDEVRIYTLCGNNLHFFDGETSLRIEGI